MQHQKQMMFHRRHERLMRYTVQIGAFVNAPNLMVCQQGKRLSIEAVERPIDEIWKRQIQQL